MLRNYLACITGAFLIAASAHAAETSGRLDGTITGRDISTNRLTVAHGEVKGLMGAMTMPYEVRGQKVAALPKDGTKITAALHQSDGTLWLTDVKAADTPPAHDHAMSGMPMETPPEHSDMSHQATESKEHGMPGMQMASDATSGFLMRQSSGTSMSPAAAPMHMTMTEHGHWTLMLHGLAFVSQVVQSGPRGGDKLFSTNWIMGMAARPLGGGQLMLRSMVSLEPLTIGRKYPELFQTGETIGGRPIIDAQHPHDFFMEIAAEYAHPFTSNTIGYIYAAPFGDPALGPVAYPHRGSVMPSAAFTARSRMKTAGISTRGRSTHGPRV